MIRIGREWNIPNTSYVEGVKYYQVIFHNQSTRLSYWSEHSNGEVISRVDD